MAINANGFGILCNVEIAHQVILCKHPVLAVDQLIFLTHQACRYKVQIHVAGHLHIHTLNGKSGIVHPQGSHESQLLLPPGFKHQLVTPLTINIHAVDEVIPVKPQAEVGNRRNEVFLKEGNIVIVNVHTGVQVAQKLRDAFIFNPRKL